jgi:putative hydrolase of the HAD superfamily
MSKPPRPNCVLLDIDNTIYEDEPCHQAGMEAACAGALQLLQVLPQAFRSAWSDARTEIKRRLGKTAASHHRLLYIQRAIERLGLASQVAATLQIQNAYWTAFLERAQLLPDVYEFLDDLRLYGIPVVVITDLTAEIQFRKFLLWRLDRYVDWIVTSEEAGADKPAPQVFELALAKLGGVEGAIWMVGDSAECDMTGAKKAIGAVTIQMTHGRGAACADADFSVPTFAQLRGLLRASRDAEA